MNTAIISLGSNLGDRMLQMNSAFDAISAQVGNITKFTKIVETSSWGFDAPDFLNQVLSVQTLLSPFELLKQLQSIEKQLGRIAKTSYADGKPCYHNRTIDLDILYYNELVLSTPELTIPHPQINNRDFILALLEELQTIKD